MARSAVRQANAVFVGLAAVHGLVLAAAASIPVIAVGMWWNANTIAHNFVHRPFFRSRWTRRTFSIYLSIVLGIPQTYWRDRHLAHHAGRAGRIRVSPALVVETLIVVSVWASLLAAAPGWFLAVYAPGYAIGLALCWLQGHYEHAGGTTSHYGRLYNVLFFNDGYHVEHHRRPSAHWTDLPRETQPADRASRWPAVLRWLDAVALDGLERLVLRSNLLKRVVLDRHERAVAALLAGLPPIRRIAIVGGGLFPRTALILRKLLPHAAITIVDSSAANLQTARALIGESATFVHRAYVSAEPLDADLAVIPLAFRGDRARLYRHPPAPFVMVHDWFWTSWRARGHGRARVPAQCLTAPVSLFLLKRINLVTR